MVRVVVLYEAEPDPERYARHVDEVVGPLGVTFRHGKVFGVPFGEPRFAYYAEFELPDMDSFRKTTSTPEFAATGRDAAAMGIPFTVHFVELD
jgi:hypothetical protein